MPVLTVAEFIAARIANVAPMSTMRPKNPDIIDMAIGTARQTTDPAVAAIAAAATSRYTVRRCFATWTLLMAEPLSTSSMRNSI